MGLRTHWQRAAALMLAQADVNELARQLHLALFLDGHLILWELQ
jgi:hypothetical protein